MSKGPFASTDTLKDYLDVSVHTVRQWVRAGKIPKTAYMKIGMTYRFHVPAVQDALMHYEERRNLTEAEREEFASNIVNNLANLPSDEAKHVNAEDAEEAEDQLEFEYTGVRPVDNVEIDPETVEFFDDDLEDL